MLSEVSMSEIVPAVRSRVPEGTSGSWRLERFVVPERLDGYVELRPWWAQDEPGTYTRLVDGSETYMSDLYVELHTQAPAIVEARRCGGRILITGLGMGLIVEAILSDPQPLIDEIVIIEYSADVISLVQPYLHGRFGSMVRIEQGDARTWQPDAGEHFSVGWHDIWADPWSETAAVESALMRSHFDEVCDWQGSWSTTFVHECKAADQPRESIGRLV